MYTDCTVLFSSAQAHFTKENKNMFAFQTYWRQVPQYKCMQTGVLLPCTQVQLGQAKCVRNKTQQKTSEKKVSLFFTVYYHFLMQSNKSQLGNFRGFPTYKSMRLVVIRCTVEYISCPCVHKISWIVQLVLRQKYLRQNVIKGLTTTFAKPQVEKVIKSLCIYTFTNVTWKVVNNWPLQRTGTYWSKTGNRNMLLRQETKLLQRGSGFIYCSMRT